jgi:hypothetical protein
MADKVELLFQFDTQGAPQLEVVEKIVEKLGQSSALTSGQINLVEQALIGLVKSGSSAQEALEIVAGSAKSLGASAANAAKDLLSVAKAADTTVPKMYAAAAAIQGIDGSLNLRSAERFLTQFQGINTVLQSTFSIFGGIALVDLGVHAIEGVAKFYDSINPVIAAEKEYFKVMEDGARTVEQLQTKERQLYLDRITRTQGTAAGLRAAIATPTTQEGINASEVALYADLVTEAQKALDDATAHRVLATRAHHNPGTESENQETPSERAAKIDLKAANENYRVALEKVKADADQKADTGDKLADTVQQKRLETAKKVFEIEKEIEALHQHSLLLAARANFGTGPIADIEVRRVQENIDYSNKKSDLAAEQRENQLGGPDTVRVPQGEYDKKGAALDAAHTQNLSSLFAERLAAVQKAADEYADAAFKAVQDISEYTERAATESVRKLDKLVDDAHKAGIKQKEETNKVSELGDKADETTIQQQFRKTGRLTELAAPVGSTQSGLDTAAKAYQQELSLAQAIDAIEQRRVEREAELSALKGTEYDKEYALAQEHLRLTQEDGQAAVAYALKVAEIEHKRLEDARNEAGKVFDALVGGQKSIEGLAKNFALSQGKAVFENLTQGLFASGSGALHSLVSPGSPLASALTGTVFEPNGGNTPVDKNTAALDRLTLILSRVGGIGGAGSTSGLAASLPFGIGGSVRSLAGLFNSSNSTSALTVNDLPLNLGGDTAATAAGFGDGTPNYAQEAQDANIQQSGGLSFGQDVGIAGAVAGAGFGIYSGIQQGGARGATTAVGSVGAATAAIGTILGAASIIPVVGSLIAVAAPLITALLPNPKTQFANDQANTLNNDRYTMPLAIQGQYDEATGSNAVTKDYRGGTTVVLQNNTTVHVNALDYDSLASRGPDLAKVLGDVTRAGNPDMMIAINRAVFGPTAG